MVEEDKLVTKPDQETLAGNVCTNVCWTVDCVQLQEFLCPWCPKARALGLQLDIALTQTTAFLEVVPTKRCKCQMSKEKRFFSEKGHPENA